MSALNEIPQAALGLPFEHLLAEVREGITVSDPRLPDNPLVYVNPGFEKMTGYSSAEVMGRNCRFLQGRKTDPYAVQQMRQAQKSLEPRIIELINYRKDGTPFWNSVSLSPVLDEHGRLQYFIGLQMDVTERRLREEREREFVDSLSHEMKTPLAAQMGIVETLQLQPEMDSGKRSSMYERLKKQTVRLIQTVEDILNLSFVDTTDAGQMEMIDMREPVLSALDSAEGMAGKHRIELAYELPEEAIALRADPQEITMLASNLLSNAVKYSQPGGRVKLTLTRRLNAAILHVSDSGMGIAPEYQQRIFERFYRVDKARSRASGGTGLGLAIVREVVEKYGGRISLQSEEGKGSTFSITLPVSSKK